MQFTVRKRRQTPAVIIVSLIDVLIVVLIFLVATTTFKRPAAVKLALPESAQSKPGSAASEPLFVDVGREPPHLYFRGAVITPEKLAEELKTLLRTDPARPVALRADDAAPFGIILKVMDAARAAGVTNFSAHTKPAGK